MASENGKKDYTRSFMRSLCLGSVEEDIVFPFPKIPDAQAEMVRSVADTVNKFLAPREAEFRKWDTAGEMPAEIVEEMKAIGLFSIIIPEEFGGLGFGPMAYSRTLQELSRHDGSVALTAGAHSSIGMKGLILMGTEEQKAKYLPKLASGELIAAFCLTEAGAGSDAASVKTHAVRDGDDWILTGEKIWITNGGIADFFTVFAKTDTPEGKMTAFIVTRDMAGVTTGPHEDKMGLRASSTTTVVLDNVRVPAANVLGEVGKGFKVAMKILNHGRTGLGGGCVGSMKHVIAAASKQARDRKQFGQSISEFGLIKQKLGHMIVECYATESVVQLVGGLIEEGYEDYAVEAAISKVFASEALWRTVDEGLQIAGGNGFMREFPYERIMRDSRVNRIFEGTNDILHLFIALTSINDVGHELKEFQSQLGNVLVDPIKGFGSFMSYARKRFRGEAVAGAHKLTKVHPEILQYGYQFEEHSRELTSAVYRLLTKHGKNIVNKQFATKRLASIMIDMFVFVAVISRVSKSLEEKGTEACKEELRILKVFAGQVSGRIARNYRKIDDNDDEDIKALSDHAVANEGYTWDIL